MTISAQVLILTFILSDNIKKWKDLLHNTMPSWDPYYTKPKPNGKSHPYNCTEKCSAHDALFCQFHTTKILTFMYLLVKH